MWELLQRERLQADALQAHGEGARGTGVHSGGEGLVYGQPGRGSDDVTFPKRISEG